MTPNGPKLLFTSPTPSRPTLHFINKNQGQTSLTISSLSPPHHLPCNSVTSVTSPTISTAQTTHHHSHLTRQALINVTGANCNFLFGAKSDKRPGSIQVIQWMVLLLGYLKWDPRDPIITYIKKKKEQRRVSRFLVK